MIASLYEAIRAGDTDTLNRHNIDDIKDELTGHKNTVLHVAAQFGQLDCVNKILEQWPSLLYKRNCKGDTPLHIAAREGNPDIVKALIDRAKQLESREGKRHSIVQALRDKAVEFQSILLQALIGQRLQHGGKKLLTATNSDEDTALHVAVQNGHLEIVKLLATEDREFSYPANKAKETPLYLAVERDNYGMVVQILENCASQDYSGPYGRTALHEAVIKRGKLGIAEALLKWKQELICERDARGWIPLHHAALHGNVEGVKMILEINPSLANETTGRKDDRKTALHIAVAVGKVEVVKEILSACPDCWEIVDSTGQNILHIAVVMEREEVIEYIFEMSWLTQLIKQKDKEGNTPLHLLAASDFKRMMPLQTYDGYWFTLNNKNMSPAQIASPEKKQDDYNPKWLHGRNIVSVDEDIAKWGKDREDKRKAQEDEYNEKAERNKKMAKSQLIVASLLATITFAASFTIPGGYDPNPDSEQGKAILLKEAAFKAFVITNTFAVLLSTSSVYLFLTAMMLTKQSIRYMYAFFFLECALLATMVAFITGTYSMLSHSWLAIFSCVMGSSFIYYFYPADFAIALEFYGSG